MEVCQAFQSYFCDLHTTVMDTLRYSEVDASCGAVVSTGETKESFTNAQAIRATPAQENILVMISYTAPHRKLRNIVSGGLIIL